MGQTENVLWVPDQSSGIPGFAVQNMVDIVRTEFMRLNGLVKHSRDVKQQQKREELLTREQILHLMIPSLEFKGDHNQTLNSLNSMNFNPTRPHDAATLSEDEQFLNLINLIAAQSGNVALRYDSSIVDEQSLVGLESGIFPLPVTGSKVEFSAHSLMRFCTKDAASYSSWLELPKPVRQFLLNCNSLSAVILILRFMGFQQNQLQGLRDFQNPSIFRGSILNTAQLSEKFGKFTPQKNKILFEFIRRIYDYSDQALWLNHGYNRMYPQIGWPSLRGLGQEDVLSLANQLDSGEYLVPEKYSSQSETADPDHIDWLAPTDYSRFVKYTSQYRTLIGCLQSDQELWGDILADELWCNSVIGSHWTNSLLHQRLDLFPVLSAQSSRTQL